MIENRIRPPHFVGCHEVNRQTKIATVFIVIALGVLLLDGCGVEQGNIKRSHSETPIPLVGTPSNTQVVSQPAPSPSATPQTSPSNGLTPPDATYPAAGVCARPTADKIVTITIVVGAVLPRCASITPAQRLRVVNETDVDEEVQLGPLDLVVKPGGAELLDAPFGSYLAPGVHRVLISPLGFGPELVLDGDG